KCAVPPDVSLSLSSVMVASFRPAYWLCIMLAGGVQSVRAGEGEEAPRALSRGRARGSCDPAAEGINTASAHLRTCGSGRGTWRTPSSCSRERGWLPLVLLVWLLLHVDVAVLPLMPLPLLLPVILLLVVVQ